MLKSIKKNLILVSYALLLFFVLYNIKSVSNFVVNIYNILKPFILGFAIAYIVNIPYVFILNHIFKVHEIPNNIDRKTSRKKLWSIVLAYLFFFVIIGFIAYMLIPQIFSSIQLFIENFSTYYDSLTKFVQEFVEGLHLKHDFWQEIQVKLPEYKNQIMKAFNGQIPAIIEWATITATKIFNIVFAFLLSIYFIASKELLLSLISRSTRAFTRAKLYTKLVHYVDVTNYTFRGFVVGQLTDALIVGVITCVCSFILRFPYPILLGFIAGVTNVIPVLGPFIGAVPCFIIIVLVSPLKAIWYLIFVVVLQQVDGNIICPKIVGDAINLEGIWVLFAVIIGGGLFGILGSVLFVPFFAVIYKLYNEWLDHKLSKPAPEDL